LPEAVAGAAIVSCHDEKFSNMFKILFKKNERVKPAKLASLC
jgi:hypothetical protein